MLRKVSLVLFAMHLVRHENISGLTFGSWDTNFKHFTFGKVFICVVKCLSSVSGPEDVSEKEIVSSPGKECIPRCIKPLMGHTKNANSKGLMFFCKLRERHFIATLLRTILSKRNFFRQEKDPAFVNLAFSFTLDDCQSVLF